MSEEQRKQTIAEIEKLGEKVKAWDRNDGPSEGFEITAISSSIMSLDIKLPEGYCLQEGVTPVNLALPENTLDGILRVK